MKTSSIFLVVMFASVMSAAMGGIVSAVIVDPGPTTPAPSNNGLTANEVERLLAQQEASLRDSLAEERQQPEPAGVSEEDVVELFGEMEEALLARARAQQPEVPDVELDESGAQALTALAEQIAEMNNRLAELEEDHTSFVEEEDQRAEERMREQEEQRRRQMMEGMLRAAPAIVPRATQAMTGRLSEELELSEHQEERVQETLQENLMRAAEIARENQLEGNLSDEEARAEFEQILEETDTDMQDILNADQYEQWEEMRDGMGGGGDGIPGLPGRNGNDDGSQGF